ncbi:sensor histidine kinase [Micromonospora fluostatini]|uniref:sensor histidine kinase n=1 Tax=Micromonospora sp. JCM 30529 TaxID=3421643 RepID=UPI003D17EFE7
MDHSTGNLLLLRTLCHELRSPIESLRSSTAVLASEPGTLSPAHRREVAALAQEQAVFLEGLLRRAVSTMQGLAEPVDEQVPLCHVLPVAVAGHAAHRVTLRLSGGARGRLVHAHRVRQIIGNLVDNALRHGPADGRVQVSASVRGRALVLVVTDQGESCRPLLAALRRTAPPPGITGLGLWIVRRLVAAEGGTITAFGGVPGVAVRVVLPAPHTAVGLEGVTD